MAALNKFIEKCVQSNTQLYLADFQYQPLKTLEKADFKPDGEICFTFSTLSEALNNLPVNEQKTAFTGCVE